MPYDQNAPRQADFTAPSAVGRGPEPSIYRLIVENARDVLVHGNAQRMRTYVSPSSREVLGFEPAELLGKHAYMLVHPDDRARVDETFAKIGPTHPCQDLQFRMQRKDGRYIWVEARYRHLPGDDGLLAVLRDITAQKLAEERLAEVNAELAMANRALQSLANQDGLTGLANRRRFDELLDTEFRLASRQQQPLGLVLVDVDCFKAYNDRYGHIAGDDCLREIARSVETVIRRPTDSAARYGGEEIVVLLPTTDLHGAILIGEQICQAVTALEIKHRGSPFGRVTVSAGAASLVPFGRNDDPLHLVEVADRALYQAKADGRNRVCWSEDPIQPQAEPALAGGPDLHM